jgi:hypothetical protein
MPPRRPSEQCAPYGEASRSPIAGNSSPATGLPHRHDDRGSDEEGEGDAEAPRLKVLVRFKDLKAASVVNNWPALIRLIEDEGFPPGFWLGKNTRAWALADVADWLSKRPIARKIVPPRRTNTQETSPET